jgi:hypothetical protein
MITIISPCLLVDYRFYSEITITNKYSIKPTTISLKKGEFIPFTLSYNNDYIYMYLCFSSRLNQSLSKYLTFVKLKIMHRERQDCILIEPNLCNNSFTICYFFTDNRDMLEVIFNKDNLPKGVGPMGEAPDKFISSKRVDYINKNSRRFLTGLRDLKFTGLKLTCLKKLYIAISLSLEGKVDGDKLKGFGTRIDGHFKRNAFYYKDELGKILNFVTGCVIKPKKTVNDYAFPEYFIIRLSGKKLRQDVITNIWEKYDRSFIRITALNSNYFKPIMALFLTQNGLLTSFETLYNKEKCYQPSNIEAMFSIEEEKVKKYLSFPKCAENAIKMHVKDDLLKDMVGLLSLFVEISKKERN